MPLNRYSRRERQGAYHTCWVECIEQNRADAIEFPVDIHSPLKGQCIALGQTQTLGLGRMGQCRRADMLGTADFLGT